MKESNIIITIFFALLLTALETIGQSSLHKFFNQKLKQYYLPIITIGCYLVCIFLLYHSYSYVNMGVMEVMWNSGTNIIIPIAGLLLFKNKISFYGWIGILLTTIGSVLVGLY